ncbi:MAG: FAD-dependent monooxygenase [Parvibaculaceae bacterium]
MTTALIVGAGPVGLTMAVELARYGVPVRIVDRDAARTGQSRAIVVWPRTIELLERAGLAGKFLAAGLKITHGEILAGAEHLARMDFSEVPSAYRFVLSIPQSETERLLEERLAALGVTVERACELQSFADEGEAVACTLRRADGATETARFDWLIGCDGARSTVRQTLKLDFHGDTLPENFVLADIEAAGLTPEELTVIWSDDGVLLCFPLPGGRHRLIADVGAEPRHDPSFAEIQAIVARRAPGVTISDPVWLSGFAINERMVQNYRTGRVFVAGDAAHIHSPAGGQGMNTGMQDAFNLAWKLALVVDGAAAPALLDSYGPERSGVAKQILSDSGRLTRAGLMKGRIEQHIRNFAIHVLLGFRVTREKAAARMAELTIRYPDSPLSRGAAHDGPAPGERIVAGPAFGAGDAPRLALLAADTPEARAFLRGHAGLVEPALRPALGDGLIRLVRPDGYVAAAARPGEWDVIQGCMDAIAGRAGVALS